MLRQRRLEPDDTTETLGAVADPDSHQTIQMARADAATSGEIADANAPLRAFDVTQRPRDDGVHLCVGQAFEEKPLERVDALFRRASETVVVSERTKCGAAEPDPSALPSRGRISH
jgi:hypothetical protein